MARCIHNMVLNNLLLENPSKVENPNIIIDLHHWFAGQILICLTKLLKQWIKILSSIAYVF